MTLRRAFILVGILVVGASCHPLVYEAYSIFWAVWMVGLLVIVVGCAIPGKKNRAG